MSWRQWIERLASKPGPSDPDYEAPHFQQRLWAVRKELAESLNRAPPGPVRIISMCSGNGRDVIGVLVRHSRRADVSAWLVESNRRTIADGNGRMIDAALEQNVRFLQADATAFASYRNIAPADIVLLCGVWGHVPPPDRVRLVGALASLCKPGGEVIWTRGISKGMNRLREIQSLFDDSSWKQLRISLTPDENWGILTYRYSGAPMKLPESGHFFHFRSMAGAS